MLDFVVLGGGIAGVQCAEELARLCPTDIVTLISATKRIKGVGNIRRITKNVEEFVVVEKNLDALPYTNLRAVQATAVGIDVGQKLLKLSDGCSVSFSKLCICSGAAPKVVSPHPQVLNLRDQDTVEELSGRLRKARRVVLVGNGGIATELAYSLRGVEVVWAVKHDHICDAFLDADAGAFLATKLQRRAEGGLCGQTLPSQVCNLPEHEILDPVPTDPDGGPRGGFGHSVGPQWAANLPGGVHGESLQLELSCTVQNVADAPEGSGWLVAVKLSNGRTIEADFVISAVGVTPNTQWLGQTLALHPTDRGIHVNREMETSVPDIFAAGDACSIDDCSANSHWFQMRLWTQAKVMGTYAAHCMAGTQESAGLAFNFELFTHVTRFLGLKVVLLGLYNGQTISESRSADLVSYSRCAEGPDSQFIRVLLLGGKMVGAVLIGETDLEETFENLILDGLDLSCYGPDLLDPDVEIDHMFD